MKWALGLLLVTAIGVFAAVKYGGIASFDPDGQAAEFRQQIKIGMSWREVADLRAPKKVTPIVPFNPTGKGPGAKFNADELGEALEQGGYGDGFVFEYTFSSSSAFEVIFYDQGRVGAVEDLPTFNSLL